VAAMQHRANSFSLSHRRGSFLANISKHKLATKTVRGTLQLASGGLDHKFTQTMAIVGLVNTNYDILTFLAFM